MNAVLDIGNTFVKMGAFEGDTLRQHWAGLTPADALAHLRQLQPAHVIGSSVGAIDWLVEVAGETGRLWLLTPDLPVPLVNHYDTPRTLGMDRLAAAVGAKALFPDDPCLVIDAGTCITCDFVDDDSHYWGGSIAPGVRMRLRAMHHFTARLPLPDLPDPALPIELLGRSTHAALLSGAVNGAVAELEGLLAAHRQRVPHLRALLCGGDTALFESRIKSGIFAFPTLVLTGLNRILQHNLSRECI